MIARTLTLAVLASAIAAQPVWAAKRANPAPQALSTPDMPIGAAETQPARPMTAKEAKAAAEEAARADAEARRPADAAARAAIARADLVTQARFWDSEYAKNPAELESGQALADILRRIGSYDRSIQIAQASIQQHPNDVKLWTTLGLTLLAAQRGADAVGPLQRAVALDPKSPRLASSLGIAYDQMGRSDLARTAYTQALALSPEDPAILTNLGFSWILSGDLKQAESVLRRAVASPLAPVQARQNLAMVIGLQGRFAEAEKLAAQDVPPELAAQNIAWLRSMVEQPGRWDSLRASPQ